MAEPVSLSSDTVHLMQLDCVPCKWWIAFCLFVNCRSFSNQLFGCHSPGNIRYRYHEKSRDKVQHLTQNSSKSVNCETLSIELKRFLAKSNVVSNLFSSKFSIFSIPFSDMYSSSKLISFSRFSILTIRFACNARHRNCTNLSRFSIFLILFLLKYK